MLPTRIGAWEVTVAKYSGMDRRAFLALTGVAGLGLTAGCSSGLKSSAGTSGTTVRIGYVSPRTGSLADFTASDPFVLAKVRAAVANGITAGGKKYDVQIITQDSQSDATRAGQVAQQLINTDQVDLMLTTSTPDTVNPVSDQCEAAGVPCLGTIVPWQSWFNARGGTKAKPFTYTYLYFIGLEDELAALPPAWQRAGTNKKVGGLWPNDADGDAFRTAFGQALPGNGFSVVNPGPYQDGAQDFTAIINQLKAADAEILQAVPLPPDFATFWKQADQLGYKPKVASIAKAILFPSAVEALGPLGENLMTDAWWTPTMPYKSSFDGTTASQFAANYISSTGRQWTQPMAFNHAIFEIAVAVLRSVDDPKDRKAVADAIGKAKGEAITGSYDFTSGPVKNVATHPDFTGQWQKSKDSRFPYDLYVVDNTMDSTVPVTASLKPLS